MSGSCSPVTAAQIREALRSGFVGIVQSSLATLASGDDALLYTAVGPDDAGQVELSESEMIAFNDQLGAVLGRILKRVLQASHVRRAVVAGGDTSSHAVRQLGLHAPCRAGGSWEPAVHRPCSGYRAKRARVCPQRRPDGPGRLFLAVKNGVP